MSNEGREIGAEAERVAMGWLRKRGYMIRDLNWRAGRYELDIVAERFGVVHFVEVKCRKAGGFTTPEEAMTPTKRDSLVKAARAYVAQYRVQEEYQFDLIAVDRHPDSTFEVRLIERAIEFRW